MRSDMVLISIAYTQTDLQTDRQLLHNAQSLRSFMAMHSQETNESGSQVGDFGWKNQQWKAATIRNTAKKETQEEGKAQEETQKAVQYPAKKNNKYK